MFAVSTNYNSIECSLPLSKISDNPRNTAPLMSDLPANHVVRTFSRLKNLQIEAEKILESLERNGDGNQFLVVLNLTPKTIQKLDEEHDSCLGGIQYRFQWEGTSGLIKVVPSKAYDIITDKVTRVMDRKTDALRVDWVDTAWVGTSTYKLNTTRKGKQPDQAFLPPSRIPQGLSTSTWPTLVIETGVSESLNRLREDARKWFIDSEGAVRIVLVISIKPTEVTFEKWQLAPENAPHPLTKMYLDSLRQTSPNVPPRNLQPVSTQQPYSEQEVYVQRNAITGAPLRIPSVALFDQLPERWQGDLIIEAQDFRNITRLFF